MSWFYRCLLRPVLFTQNAEEIHNRTMAALGWASRHELVAGALESFFGGPELPIEVFGLRFPHPVGLAAGMDKYAEALPIWQALGFGFTELGAVTWLSQPGNPPPRVFRAIRDEAIINRMGFNNPGAQAVAQTLAQWRALGRWPQHPVGMNLGKSKLTPLVQAPQDYADSLRVLLPHLDFFVVNVSSPNTPNLRQLQDKTALDEILAALNEVQSPKSKVQSQPSDGQRGSSRDETPGETFTHDASRITAPHSPAPNPLLPTPPARKPLLVKVAPDLSFDALDEILQLVSPRQVAGIVATNTTITRPQAAAQALQQIYSEAGGLSGRPLRARSTEVVRHLYRQTKGTLPIIGVGGIFDAADAWEKITAGASLVQLYTGLVYEGPGLAKAIVTGLLERLEQAGMTALSEAIGIAAR
ncbi:MAG TPA: quinone-dependent dihydroorotate dehydrogenase [Candidatus Binatia bacterium]|jgi:dihydroorotate dehydrogenase|nr:quinone-dependent dihydroorotate dehydrogenase [Candidatus Binatia bacterium]